MSATSANGLAVRPERDRVLGVADDPEDRARLVDLDDVAAVAALDHVAAEFLDQHRRRTGRGARARLPASGGRAVGAARHRCRNRRWTSCATRRPAGHLEARDRDVRVRGRSINPQPMTRGLLRPKRGSEESRP